MGYTGKSGRFQNIRRLELVKQQPYAATFNGPALEIADRGTACLTLDVTAITGTLDVTVQTSSDGTGTGAGAWRTANGGTFSQASGVGSQRVSFTGLDRFARAVCTIGTGPATFSIAGDIK